MSLINNLGQKLPRSFNEFVAMNSGELGEMSRDEWIAMYSGAITMYRLSRPSLGHSLGEAERDLGADITIELQDLERAA